MADQQKTTSGEQQMLEHKRTLMDKKISELTQDDLDSLKVGLGIPGLPYPMARLTKTKSNAATAKDSGEVQHEVGVIQSTEDAMVLYSPEGMKRVNGMLFRQMPTPSMMFILRDLMAKILPHSKNRLMTVFGDAASGKSHLARLVAGLVHPKGAIVVDCGGMNMHELLFRTVIDYGHGVQDQLDRKFANGTVKQGTVDTMKAQFPGSVVEKDDKLSINWDAVTNARIQKKDEESGKTKTIEDRGDAAIRIQSVMSALYAQEDISLQTNAFGIKKVPGEFFESVWSGRPLFLDEFNKSKRGTLDSFQTALQFMNGEIDDVVLYNQMAENGDTDSPKFVKVTRDDLKPGWHVFLAGNDTSDGDTTQELSYSMETRLNPKRIGEPDLQDWEHRISQIYTGMPLTTLYNLFENEAKTKAPEFSQWLIDLRKLGLTAQEVKAIPPHEIYLLQNFTETVTAIKQVAKYYKNRADMADPESELMGKKEYQNLADEIQLKGKRIRASFRKAIADFNKAIQSTPGVRPAAEAKLNLNLSEVFNGFDASSIAEAAPGWHRLGANLADAFLEDIVNDTVGMRQTRAALVTLCEDNGLLRADLQETKASKVKTIADLLKYDPHKDLGGTEELSAVRSMVVAALKNIHAKQKFSGADDKIIPLVSVGQALKELNRKKGGEEAWGGSFVMPNANLDEVMKKPLVESYAVRYAEDHAPEQLKKGYVLADFRAVLAGLAMPEYAQSNMEVIWPKDLIREVPGGDKLEPDMLEAYKSLSGNSSYQFDLVMLRVLDSKAKESHMCLIEDKFLRKRIVIGPEKIDDRLKSELSKNGIDYKMKGDEEVITFINSFLAVGAKSRAAAGLLNTKDETKSVIEGLIKAFTAVSGVDHGTIEGGATLGEVMSGEPDAFPGLYTSILKPKTA